MFSYRQEMISMIFLTNQDPAAVCITGGRGHFGCQPHISNRKQPSDHRPSLNASELSVLKHLLPSLLLSCCWCVSPPLLCVFLSGVADLLLVLLLQSWSVTSELTGRSTPLTCRTLTWPTAALTPSSWDSAVFGVTTCTWSSTSTADWPTPARACRHWFLCPERRKWWRSDTDRRPTPDYRWGREKGSSEVTQRGKRMSGSVVKNLHTCWGYWFRPEASAGCWH